MTEGAAFEAVILDVDGTLVDSNHGHARSWTDALNEAGHAVSYEEVRRLIGMGSDQLLPRTAGIEKESPEGEAISKRVAEIFKERHLGRIAPFPRVRELLERVRGEGLRLVVATSAGEDLKKAILQKARIEDLLEAEVSSADAARSKPEPDIVEAALGRLGLPAARAVMLGDTPYDVQAAGKAGVPVIAFRCGGWGDGELKGALAVYDDPADLLEKFDSSPLAVGGRRAA